MSFLICLCDDVLPLAPNQHDLIKLMIKNKKRISTYIGNFNQPLYHLLTVHEKNNKFHKQKLTTIIGTSKTYYHNDMKRHIQMTMLK